MNPPILLLLLVIIIHESSPIYTSLKHLFHVVECIISNQKFMLHVLPPLGWNGVVAKFLDNSIIAYTCVLRIAIATFHGRNARSDAKFSVVILTLSLDLVDPFRIILLTSGKEAAVQTISINPLTIRHDFPISPWNGANGIQ